MSWTDERVELLKKMWSEGQSASQIAKELGVIQQNDAGAIEAIVDQVISENPSVVEDYKGGNDKSIQFLVGQGMKLSKGSANPGMLIKMLKEKLD